MNQTDEQVIQQKRQTKSSEAYNKTLIHHSPNTPLSLSISFHYKHRYKRGKDKSNMKMVAKEN